MVLYYGQRREDQVVENLLREYFGKNDYDLGFYIDVGAWEPEKDSITKHFYDQGWHGVNIEPAPVYFEMLNRARPGDVNIQVALGAESGKKPFYFIPHTGLSTMDERYADKWDHDRRTIEKMVVQVETLAAICLIYSPPEIDFIKIDVEGAERDVILGGDWNKFRPKVLIVEATEPGTSDADAVPMWHEWEDLVFAARYEFKYYDGLNRFYIRQ